MQRGTSKNIIERAAPRFDEEFLTIVPANPYQYTEGKGYPQQRHKLVIFKNEERTLFETHDLPKKIIVTTTGTTIEFQGRTIASIKK